MSNALAKSNGNGQSELIEAGMGGLPPWIAKMRAAAMASITEEDIQDIVKGQIEKAKKGDAAAIKFVFDQVLGGTIKGATFIQNNYPPGERPDQPTAAKPGSSQKLDAMSKRAGGGMPITLGSDGIANFLQCTHCSFEAPIGTSETAKCERCGRVAWEKI